MNLSNVINFIDPNLEEKTSNFAETIKLLQPTGLFGLVNSSLQILILNSKKISCGKYLPIFVG
jgi:hypothetical protein